MPYTAVARPGAFIRTPYRGVPAWQRAMDLAAACHALARRMPPMDRRTAPRRAAVLRLRQAALDVAREIADGSRRHALGETAAPTAAARQALDAIESALRAAADMRTG